MPSLETDEELQAKQDQAPAASEDSISDTAEPAVATASKTSTDGPAELTPLEALPEIAPDLNPMMTQVEALEARVNGQGAWNDIHAANNTQILEMMGDMSLRIWKLEMALCGEEGVGHYLPIQDQINNARLEERVVLSALQGSATRRRSALDVKKGHGLSIEQQWAELEALTPAVFEKYKSAYDLGEARYKSEPEARCSSGGHAEARKFGQFIKPYLNGRILDVGCGPQKRASYLDGVGSKNLYGIDPIAPEEAHDFNFEQALGEFIPWEDKAFDTIISATTLDHYCNLERGLDEAARSLKVGGHFVCWIMLVDGSEPYDHQQAENANADEEHLFHVDLKWLEPMMKARGFELFEIMRFSAPFNYAFFSYELKRKT